MTMCLGGRSADVHAAPEEGEGIPVAMTRTGSCRVRGGGGVANHSFCHIVRGGGDARAYD